MRRYDRGDYALYQGKEAKIETAFLAPKGAGIYIISYHDDSSRGRRVELTVTGDELQEIESPESPAQYALTQAAERVQAIEGRMSQAAKEGRKGDVENDRPVLAQAYQDFYAKWKACQ